MPHTAATAIALDQLKARKEVVSENHYEPGIAFSDGWTVATRVGGVPFLVAEALWMERGTGEALVIEPSDLYRSLPLHRADSAVVRRPQLILRRVASAIRGACQGCSSRIGGVLGASPLFPVVHLF